MKIAMFTNTFLPHVGGVANSVARAAEDLRAAGHVVLVVAPVYSEKDRAGDLDADGVLRLPSIRNVNKSGFSLRLPVPFVVSEKLDVFAPDVIHSHHPYIVGDTALRSARRLRRPLVFTHHTLYEKYTHYVPLDSEILQEVTKNIATGYANLCDRVVAPSESIAELITDRGVTAPIDVIPTGVDTGVFSPGNRKKARQALDLPEDALVAGHVGRLAPEKNLEFLARALARFLKSTEKARFLVVGDGPSREAVTGILEDAGVAGRVMFAGYRQGRDLVTAYQAMDVFVFSSRSETQGMVLTEAMACGVPVVALDGPGVREVVEDGTNGRLLPADAHEAAFGRALREWADDPDTKNAWAEAARNTAEAFSRKAVVKKLVATYEAAAADHEGSESHAVEPWEALLDSMETEMDLLSQKATALFKAITDGNFWQFNL